MLGYTAKGVKSTGGITVAHQWTLNQGDYPGGCNGITRVAKAGRGTLKREPERWQCGELILVFLALGESRGHEPRKGSGFLKLDEAGKWILTQSLQKGAHVLTS